MKTLIYFLGLAVLGYIAYNFLMKDDSSDSIILNPPQNDYLKTQPQEKYPLIISKDPRVDNANQPWYSGDRSFTSNSGMSLNDAGNSLNYQTDASWTALASSYSH